MGKDSSGKGVGSNPQKDLSLGAGSLGGGKAIPSASSARGERASASGGSRKGNFSVDDGNYRLDFPVLRSRTKEIARAAAAEKAAANRERSPVGESHTADVSDSSNTDEEEEGARQPSRPMVLETDLPEVYLVDSPTGSLSRKRPTSPVVEGPVAPKVGTARRGGLNRRPAAHSYYLAAAKNRLAVHESGAESVGESDDEPLVRPTHRDLKVAHESDGEAELQAPRGLTKESLAAAALLNVATIQEQVKKCGHIKGTTWGSINRAAAGVIDAVEALRTITPAEEHRRLRADNNRLARELDVVRAELKAFKQAFEESRARPVYAASEPAVGAADLREVIDELRRDLQLSLGGMINARLGELETRLPPEKVLRPPLAADRRQEPPARPRAQPNLAAGAMSEPSRRQQPKTAPAVPEPQPQQGKSTIGPKKGPKKGPNPVPQAQSQPVAGPSWRTAPALTENGDAAPSPWSQVVGRKGRRGNIPPQPPKTPAPRAKAPPPKTKAVKIVAPRTAAIVVTLKEGVTTSMVEVLAKAKASISLADFGLESVKIRTTMTGSRMMEVGGERPQETADLLAARLRAVVGDQAEISRPTKLADLKVSGLNEMVDREELAAAMAKLGGCAPDQIKVGAIRSSAWGQGSALVRCPAVAAKAIATAGRIPVGWTMATARPVEAQPFRCYKCMALGHTRALCPSEVEHGKKCFRCGVEGHLAATCEVVAKCAVCAQAGRPHGHRMGGSNCIPPTIKGRAPSTRAPPSRGQQANEELVMQVS